MTQLLHIFGKDLRRLRWWLALWVMLLALLAAEAIVGPRTALNGVSEAILVSQLEAFTAAVFVIMLALLTSKLVHDEPLVGLDWFWISRPYDWRSLMAAKLLLAGIFFVALPLVGHLIVMRAFGAGVGDMVRVAPDFIASDLQWMLAWMAIAVVTRSLATFSLAVVGAMVSMVLMVLTALTIFLWNGTGERPPDTTAPLNDASVSIVAGLIFIGGATATIVIAYRQRRLGRSLIAMGTGLTALIVVPMLWPWRFAAVWSALDRDAALRAVEASIDLELPPHLGYSHWPGHERARQVQAPTRLAHLPSRYRVQGTFAASRLVFRDGRVLESSQSGGSAGGDAAISEHPLQRLFPDARVLPAAAGGSTAPLVGLLTVTDDDIRNYGSQPGRLTTTVNYQLVNTRILGVLPLTPGASLLADSFRVDLLSTDPGHGGFSIVTRHWRTFPPWSPSPYPQNEFVIRNSRRREVIVGDAFAPQTSGLAFSLPLSLIGMNAPGGGSRGFFVHHTRTDFPARVEGKEAVPAIDGGWLSDAELVVIESVGAGWLTRTLTVDGFQIQPATTLSASEPAR